MNKNVIGICFLSSVVLNCGDRVVEFPVEELTEPSASTASVTGSGGAGASGGGSTTNSSVGGAGAAGGTGGEAASGSGASSSSSSSSSTSITGGNGGAGASGASGGNGGEGATGGQGQGGAGAAGGQGGSGNACNAECCSDADCVPEAEICVEGVCVCDGDPEPECYGGKDCGEGKVLLCHVPKGNPEAMHEICVGEQALDAHMDHGDVLGCCVVE